MATMICKVCGGHLQMDSSGEYSTCDSCGTQYTVETMRNMLQALSEVVLNVKGIATVDSLIRRARLLCEDGEFSEAQEIIEQALSIDPEIGEIYLIALMADRSCNSEEQLVEFSCSILSENSNFQKALRFGDETLSRRLECYDKQVRENIAMKPYKAALAETILNNDNSDACSQNQVRWKVLHVSNNYALAITENCVALMPYNQQRKSITWEHCTLRKWLNTEYYNSLPVEIRTRVVEVENSNPDLKKYKTFGGNNTHDKVFLLSIQEIKRYFGSDSERIAKYEGADRFWWLRSPGIGQDYAAAIDAVGHGSTAYNDGAGGVRPALWINLDV